MRSTLVTAVLFSAVVLVLGACSPTPTSSTNEEAAIRAQNVKWLEAIAKHDADAVAAMYAQDGEFLPPNSAKVTGRERIKAAWQAMFQIPGVSLTFATDKFVFGSSNDLAVDIGSYEFKSSSGASSASDKGKSVVTWVKHDGDWQVLTDMFSSDAPTLQSTPSVPAAAATTLVPATPTTPPAAAATTAPTPAPATPPAH